MGHLDSEQGSSPRSPRAQQRDAELGRETLEHGRGGGSTGQHRAAPDLAEELERVLDEREARAEAGVDRRLGSKGVQQIGLVP